jgi:hypothetical protein
MLHLHTIRAIANAIQTLVDHPKINGTVRVVTKLDKSQIDISFDNRKYIGRIRLELQEDKYLVYLMDKANGKISTSDKHASKSAYMEIKNKAEATLFVKWYILLTQLAALKRNRA